MESQKKVNNYKDLRFWQTAFKVNLLVVRLAQKFPNKREFWIIADQIIRASFSVGANIAEGFGRYKGKEYVRFLQISLGSANEVEYWLLVIKELIPSLNKEIDEIMLFNLETIKMLAKSLKTIRMKK